MLEKERFEEEFNECGLPAGHVIDNIGNIDNHLLLEIDELYGIFDALSVKNAKTYHNFIKWLAIIGTVIAFSFLFYDMTTEFWSISLCALYMLILFVIKKSADKLDCHRKYLHYRVIAETFKVQFFTAFAGIKKPVKDMVPLIVKNDIPQIDELLSALDLNQTPEKSPIVKEWIVNQRDYHKNALEKNKRNYRREQVYQKYSLILTIIAYFLLLIFEISLFSHFMNWDADLIRSVLKMIVGFGAAYTLFSSNYYGKMSLSDMINNNKRMILIYDEIESEIDRNDGVESEEIVMYLANECLIENSMWYSSQINNKPGWVL